MSTSTTVFSFFCPFPCIEKRGFVSLEHAPLNKSLCVPHTVTPSMKRHYGLTGNVILCRERQLTSPSTMSDVQIPACIGNIRRRYICWKSSCLMTLRMELLGGLCAYIHIKHAKTLGISEFPTHPLERYLVAVMYAACLTHIVVLVV